MQIERQPPLILVVEDDDCMRQVLSKLLLDEGFRVAEAARSADAFTLLHTISPSAVVLDLALPGAASGLDLLWECEDSATTTAVPVIVVSAYADVLPSDALACTASVLQKPVDLDELLITLKRLVLDSP
jgi:two-component system, OmpR family, phosphate regulon response regulator OmpR